MMTSHPINGVSEAQDAVPIFILGMRPRTGTHFLANLLCQHPQCVSCTIAEDSLLVDAHLLARYVRNTNSQWTLSAGKPLPGYDELLFRSIGDGLVSFLRELRNQAELERSRKFGDAACVGNGTQRLVTKTPHSVNLEYFFRLFPGGYLLILVRDGRAVVESNLKSFGGDPEHEIRAWASAANKILEFTRDSANQNRKFMLVRFEDLHSVTEAEMRKILSFLNLDVGQYDFQAAINLPVVGSSSFKRPPGKVRWLPVRKTPDFDPIARADNWTRSQHERFNWIAGRQLEQLGYDGKFYKRMRHWWTLWNMAMDFKWKIRKYFGRIPARRSKL